MNVLLDIALRLGALSLVAFGGVNAMLPEIHRLAVQESHWMNDATFAQLFAIAQAAPGPNLLIICLIGWHVAGLAGALTATVAFCGPSSALVFFLVGFWDRFRDAPWRHAVQIGIASISVGLVLASGSLLAIAAAMSWRSIVITAATVVILLLVRVHPLWLIAAGAALGLAGFS
ncbi:MAG TPA: chromate transporter [Burkholderiales bacterium]|nr:chromate transporter [Betaproteobacteria bacterium]HQR52874.1 chromate transporter [Burkholderiales bacterium]